jgi:hypothetical protein
MLMTMETHATRARASSFGVASYLAPALCAAALLMPAAADARKVVVVSNGPQLYNAVNAAGNAGALVLLAPGIYPLDPGQQNGGRLELQQGMALQGMSADPTATVIDAQALGKAQLQVTVDGQPVTTGAVRVGLGNNSLQSLTVQNANATNGAAGIATDLVGDSVAYVRIASVVARNNARGLDVRNFGTAATGRTLVVDVAASSFLDNTRTPALGIRFANVNAPNAAIQANLAANNASGNVAGCLAANVDTSDATIVLNSSADRFTGNSNGCVFIAGNRLGTGKVLDNSIRVTASASTFQHNLRQLPATFPKPGGIIAVGGQSVDSLDEASGNTLAIDLLACTMGDNQGTDITAYGAYSTGPLPAGTDNAVVLRLLATSAEVAPFDSDPLPAGTNSVVILP